MVLFVGVDSASGWEKKEVGRAMRTTPMRETRDASCADLGKGSRRKR